MSLCSMHGAHAIIRETCWVCDLIGERDSDVNTLLTANAKLTEREEELREGLQKAVRFMNASERTQLGGYYCRQCEYSKGHASDCQFIEAYNLAKSLLEKTDGS